MGLTLIVTEKDSVAKAFANVVGAEQQSGYYKGNGYVVTPCQGHLLELAMPDVYDSTLEQWTLESLPIIPEHIRFVVKNGRRLATIREWLDNNQVDTVINACDGDREGEAIFREVYQICESTKPVYRVWISSTEPDSVRKGLDNMRPSSEYDNLADAAYSRNVADWLIGINATRLFSLSLQAKPALTIGRVQTPTVNMVVTREKEIRDFKPEDYWVVTALLENGLKLSHRTDSEQQANEIVATCSGANAVIAQAEQKEKRDNPPRLYDLTSLQQDCNKLLHISAADTLANLQSLYDDGYGTYPRSDSQFITESDANAALNVMNALKGNLVKDVYPENIQCIVNNAKAEGHPANLPTVSGVKELLNKLRGGYDAMDTKWKALLLVAFRLLEATSNARVYLSTKVTADIEGYEFTATGTVTKEEGWKAVESAKREVLGQSNTDKDSILPDVAEGDNYACKSADTEKKQTTPPSRYTEATLLEAMRTCGKKLEDDAQREAMKDRGLGTPATRADILERIIISDGNDSGYITRGHDGKDKTHLYPTNRAVALMQMLPIALKDPATTGAWEYTLSQIEHGKERKEAFLEDIEEFVRDMVDTETENPRTDEEISRFAGESYATILGTCPICGGVVVPYEYKHDKDGNKLPKKRTGYRCTMKGCKLFGSNVIGGKKIPDSKIKQLLETGTTGVITGLWSDNKQRYFDAVVYLEKDEEGHYTGKQKMRFPVGEDYGPAICACPVCGSDVTPFSWTKTVMDANGKPKAETKAGWCCSNRECAMERIWNPYRGRKMTERIVARLLSKGETDWLDGFVSQKGTTYDAKLKLEHAPDGQVNGHILMEFPARGSTDQNVVCDCPACGTGKIVWFRYPSRKDGKQHTAYKCNNTDCTVTPLWPRMEHDFTLAEAKKLYTTGRTGLIQTFKGRDGKSVPAKIAANRNELGRIVATRYDIEWR